MSSKIPNADAYSILSNAGAPDQTINPTNYNNQKFITSNVINASRYENAPNKKATLIKKNQLQIFSNNNVSQNNPTTPYQSNVFGG